MGFFKEFKDDLSQAVNELLPDEKKEQEEAEDQIVNTLDSDEAADDEDSDNEKMKEWLEEFAQEETEKAETESKEELKPDEDDEQDEAAAHLEEKVSEEYEEDEDKNMDDNVDLELLDALNAEDEEKETESKEKPQPKLRAASVVQDDEVTVITKGTTINGSISSDGSLDIMGAVTGDIECLGKLSITGKVVGNSSASEVFVNTDRLEGGIVSEGSVKVGLGTVIIGDITATSGVIAGAIKGEIDINGPIVIDSTAIIKGNIKAKSVQINNGAVIEGFCSLSYADVDVDNIFE
jgi:cytoskeletal protein CcmA (bactofilin family)